MWNLESYQFITYGNNRASPRVSIRKPDGNLQMGITKWDDHQICSVMFPLQNIENANYELARMKYFVKIDLNPALNQIEIDEKFKETTTINSPIGGVPVIVVGNGHGDTSSNPGRDWLHFK